MGLSPAARRFVEHWGEMGPAWGINRTMAQVHALLFVSPDPLDAEAIADDLELSRSNVSTSVRELITWGVVRRVHIIGDRRDRFEALKDVTETFRVLMAEKKRREMDPTSELLGHCIAEAEAGHDSDAYARQQMTRMFEFCQMLSAWYGEVERLPTPALQALLKNGSKLTRLFGHFAGPDRPTDSAPSPDPQG